MDSVQQLDSVRSDLAHTFVNSLRAISASRTAEIERLTGERDSARELLRASLDALNEKDRECDRLRYNYFDLLAKHRAVMSGGNDYEERAKLDEAREMQLVIDRYEARKVQRVQSREAA